MKNIKEKILDEVTAGEGSFLIEIRIELNWDHYKFQNLLLLLNEFLKTNEAGDYLERELSAGIWYVTNFIPHWTSHESFRKSNNYSEEYYRSAYELLEFIASWYFMGHCPFIGDDMNSEIMKLRELI
ncbi:hypothetical protein SAMN05661091_1625 [Paenibacillus uliginis N3/975]|uniref:Immunity protein 41 n=1 Tax=Paenibacillus uliginis N3/975 TaxID=1313296 RepID=A0A1X7H444_9BACL|nr:hypothetical protein [Paenibacillus uliginis]SMF78877.1 hypothetical protein SAMN05661091_1625 [Paenibacillus uliginis N3/975]